jgi:hypothetical protein
MDWVTVCRHFGEFFDVFIGHHLIQMACHADLKIFDADRSAWKIVQHWSIPLGHVALQHNQIKRRAQSAAQQKVLKR